MGDLERRADRRLSTRPLFFLDVLRTPVRELLVVSWVFSGVGAAVNASFGGAELCRPRKCCSSISRPNAVLFTPAVPGSMTSVAIAISGADAGAAATNQ